MSVDRDVGDVNENDVVRRHCARVVLLDADDRVLLFHLDGARDPLGQGYWYLPGGGIGDGEEPEDAVRRELREEAGLNAVEIGPRLVHLSGVSFEFEGRTFEQDEWHILARSAAPITADRSGANEATAVAAHRWWSVAELRTASDVIYPRHLARVLGAVLRNGPPAVPFEISDRTPN
jgi:8-oxo-dGTP pyrophosphatase MutT (NUDIX family)